MIQCNAVKLKLHTILYYTITIQYHIIQLPCNTILYNYHTIAYNAHRGGGYYLRILATKLINDEPQMPNTVGWRAQGRQGTHREMTSLDLISVTKVLHFINIKLVEGEKMNLSRLGLVRSTAWQKCTTSQFI